MKMISHELAKQLVDANFPLPERLDNCRAYLGAPNDVEGFEQNKVPLPTLSELIAACPKWRIDKGGLEGSFSLTVNRVGEWVAGYIGLQGERIKVYLTDDPVNDAGFYIAETLEEAVARLWLALSTKPNEPT